MTRARYGVAAMIFVTVAINYLDRSNLSVVAGEVSRELKLDPVRMGLIFSAFGWAYAFCQIPGGWLVDRVRTRTLYASICALWSLATFLQGFAGGFLALFAFRLTTGLFEAPTFPVGTKLVTTWFPERERAAAIGFYTSGQFIGLALLTPLIAYVQHRFGWRAVFMLTGGLGITWATLLYLLYRDPWENPGLGTAEREWIRSGGGWVDGGRRKKVALTFEPSDLKFVLTQRKLWGVYLGQFSLNAVPWFFLTWFPTYLATERHIDFLKAGFFGSLPFAAACCGVVSGGLVSDMLLRRGASMSFARKAPIIAGMLLSTIVVGANFVTSPAWVILLLTISFFGNGFATITWVLVSQIAPKRLLGLTGGVFNFFGNLASILVPLIIGLMVSRVGFAPALALISAIALGGALSYGFIVGTVERIRPPMVVVVMGVAGSGKTTIGQRLAGALGCEFRDADSFHPPENIRKMSAGIPLDDRDRAPWLEAIRAYIEACLSRGRMAVVTCSALKEAYRRRILIDPVRVKLVYLRGEPELIERRLAERPGHFMKAGMLKSQFETLEPPADAIVEDVSRTPDEIVRDLLNALDD